jgi:hypothetical protein
VREHVADGPPRGQLPSQARLDPECICTQRHGCCEPPELSLLGSSDVTAKVFAPGEFGAHPCMSGCLCTGACVEAQLPESEDGIHVLWVTSRMPFSVLDLPPTIHTLSGTA